MFHLFRCPLSILIFGALNGSLQAHTIWHVDAAASAGGDGLSWASALDSIDSAFLAAVPLDRVWVKTGTYRTAIRQDPADPRSATFLIPQGVRLFGGFDGTETQLSQRAGLYEQTILTGDLGTPGDPQDNAYHVVTVNNPSGIPVASTRIDGFLIRDGNGSPGAATGSGRGGGVLVFNSAFYMSNCTLRDNRAGVGGGTHAEAGFAAIRWCKFENNQAVTHGGGIWGRTVSYRISHCEISGNTAGSNGGGVYLHSIVDSGGLYGVFAAKLINCVIRDNSANSGGGVFVGGSPWIGGKAQVNNCTIAFNTAVIRGGGIFAATAPAYPGVSRVENSIVWGNSAPEGPNLGGRQLIAYSCVEGLDYNDNGNLFSDPQFVDPVNRNLRLWSGSPANDAGALELISLDWADVDYDLNFVERTPLDLDGRRRVRDDPGAPNPGGVLMVDMGAYEF